MNDSDSGLEWVGIGSRNFRKKCDLKRKGKENQNNLIEIRQIGEQVVIIGGDRRRNTEIGPRAQLDGETWLPVDDYFIKSEEETSLSEKKKIENQNQNQKKKSYTGYFIRPMVYVVIQHRGGPEAGTVSVQSREFDRSTEIDLFVGGYNTCSVYNYNTSTRRNVY